VTDYTEMVELRDYWYDKCKEQEAQLKALFWVLNETRIQLSYIVRYPDTEGIPNAVERAAKTIKNIDESMKQMEETK